MANMTIVKKFGRGFALATALAAGVAFTAAPKPAMAIDTGAAIGLGLGALALGGVLGAATNPYYGYYGYPYSYYPPAYYGYQRPYSFGYYPYGYYGW